MESIEEENKLKTIFHSLADSAIYIALITGAVYLIAFLYLKGFYSYYGLIDIEINLSLFLVLKTCYGIIQPLLTWLLCFSWISYAIARLQDNTASFFSILNIYMLSLMFMRQSKYSDDKFEHYYYLILAISLIVLFIIGKIIIMCLPEKYKNKLSNFLDKFPKDSTLIILKSIILLGYIYIILNFIPKYGFNEAKIKKDYLYDSKNQRVLIYQDNEKSIFIPKTGNNKFERRYLILTNDSLNQIEFEHFSSKVEFNETDIKSVNVEAELSPITEEELDK